MRNFLLLIILLFVIACSEKGLYLSRTNPFYEGLNEDEVVYDVYEFR